MRCAVIGGSGFIGTRLCRRLRRAGRDFVIVDKKESLAFPKNRIDADVRDLPSLIRALEGCEVIYNLAAEHRDDVSPISLYYDVNVGGARHICQAAETLGVSKLLFTSSAAVYGFTERETDEEGSHAPFNDYGKSKIQAEEVYRIWKAGSEDRTLVILRPTVVFGEGNRGNVYHLIKQIGSGRFTMVGSGKNTKSMAYVENVAAFLEFAAGFNPGEHLFNYVDKPDLDMNALVSLVTGTLGDERKLRFRLPYWLGYSGGLFFDLVSAVTGKRYPISAIRVKKFCADTLFSSKRIQTTGFQPPVGLEEGLRSTIDAELKDETG